MKVLSAISILFLFTCIKAKKFGQLTILYSPPSLEFCSCRTVSESSIKEMFSAALGLTHNETADFKGLKIIDPFNTPEAVVDISVVGHFDPDIRPESVPNYKIEMSDTDPDTFDDLLRKITRYQGYTKPNIVVIAQSDDKQTYDNSNIFSDINVTEPSTQALKYLKYTVMEDYEFLTEIELLRALIAKINSHAVSPNGYLDFYEIYFSSLHELLKLYGIKSYKVEEAIHILNNTILELKDAFISAYKGSVLITLTSADEIKNRIDPERHGALFEQMNLRARAGQGYQESLNDGSEYASQFNLLFWFSIGYLYALIFVVSAIFGTKPDTNSIIYRLSMQRSRLDR